MKELTLQVLALTITAILILAAVCVLGMAFLPAFGHIWWTFAAVAAILAWLVVGFRRGGKSDAAPTSSRQRLFRHLFKTARWVFVGILACWLGLIVWLTVCPGGPAPPPKADPATIRVVTWNIHCGRSEGPPWKQFDWPVRK
ncbi:MAG TPA: hypothetical protein VKE94_22490, partial [Gemmataceae bacterium]|nr:hypothetical protein [Gemmataceae bacterium]